MKKAILIGVVGLCAAVVAWRVFSVTKGDDVPAGPDTLTDWMCTKCREPYKLNARQVDEIGKSADRVARGDKAKDGKTMILKCDKCNDFTVYRADKCPHGVWFCIGYDKQVACKECTQ